MTKNQLTELFARQHALPRRQAQRYINSIIEIISSELVIGRDVKLGRLGKLAIKTRKPRTAMNPQTKEPVAVPETTVVVFKSSDELKRTLNPKRYPKRYR